MRSNFHSGSVHYLQAMKEAALNFRSTNKTCTCTGIVIVSDSHKHIAIDASCKLSSNDGSELSLIFLLCKIGVCCVHFN